MTKKRQPVKVGKAAQRKRKVIVPDVPEGLTAKESRFVEEYCVDLNATQAAIRAGYSKKSAEAIGRENLGKPRIAKAVADWKRRKTDETLMTSDEIRLEMQNLALTDVGHFIRVDDEGQPVIDMTATTRRQIAALSEVTNEKIRTVGGSKDEPGLDVIKVRIKTHDRRASLMDLAKLKGDVTEKLELSGGVDLKAAHDEGLQAALNCVDVKTGERMLAALDAELARHREANAAILKGQFS